MEQFFSQLGQYIDPLYMFVFMAMAYAFKKMLNKLFTYIYRAILRGWLGWTDEEALKMECDMNLTVFIIGLLCAIPFFVWSEQDNMKMLITFTFGTSCHDLIVNYLLMLINKIIPKKETKE